MTDLWPALLPVAIASALVPVPVVVTLLLLRSGRGQITAVAWVAGQTVVRIAQGLVFGLLLSAGDEQATSGSGPGLIASVVLLVLAVVFYITALRALIGGEDPDAAPPKWLAMTETMSPGRAFLFGAGYLGISAKFWVLTLGAIAAIDEANLSHSLSVAGFLLFVVLAQSTMLAVLLFAFAAPSRSAGALDRVATWLTDNDGPIVVALGLVFGTWFLIKALTGLGVI